MESGDLSVIYVIMEKKYNKKNVIGDTFVYNLPLYIMNNKDIEINSLNHVDQNNN